MMVQPRRLAPILLGAGNVLYGMVGFLDPQRTVGYSSVPGPMTFWAGGFVMLGAVILTVSRSLNGLTIVAVPAVMLWLAWATFAIEARLAHPHLVTWKGPALLAWVALLHFLLSPYQRRP